MTKRRTIEITVETEELLVVKQRSRAISLKCSECGGPVEPFVPTAEEAPPMTASVICSSEANGQNQQ
jgi:hypothetical protein